MCEIKWVNRNESLPTEGRVLVFSPVYPVDHHMRFRIMDAQFVRISTEATHWLALEPIIPNVDGVNND